MYARVVVSGRLPVITCLQLVLAAALLQQHKRLSSLPNGRLPSVHLKLSLRHEPPRETQQVTREVSAQISCLHSLTTCLCAFLNSCLHSCTLLLRRLHRSIDGVALFLSFYYTQCVHAKSQLSFSVNVCECECE